LKVYRVPVGFHDAYVAAPSQKAALEAWGSDSNLFAQGITEQVSDPELMKEALDRPGEVIKKLRGDAGEQMRAAGKGRRTSGKVAKVAKEAERRRRAREKAEAELAAIEARRHTELAELRREEEKLAKRRRDLERGYNEERQRLKRLLSENT
jgi:hypothetical protein